MVMVAIGRASRRASEIGSPVTSQKPYSPTSMRRSAESILEMSLRCRSRVLSSIAQSVSEEARSVTSASRIGPLFNCAMVSALSRMISSFQASSFCRK
jgi:hypothetical protein